jgi:hypothetical protein
VGAATISDFSRYRAQVVTLDLIALNLQYGGLVNIAQTSSVLRGVRALVLLGGRPGTESIGKYPLALLDVLGRSVLMRTLDRVRAAGVDEIALLSDTMAPHPASISCTFTVASRECFWDEALQQFRRLARQSECVLVLRLGAWAEVDFTAMVDEFRCAGSVPMRACSQRGEALDIFAISSASQTEAAALLRGELRDECIALAEHKTFGYVNLLTSPADLRTLTLDAFAGESEIRPCGTELRPGVWVGRGARVHRRARVLAPAFIGAFCTVRRAAIITRCSSLEHHSEVDCASMIENSSVLPYSRIGAGLELECSVVGFKQVHSLRRNTTVDIEDPHLIGTTSNHFYAWAFSAVSWLLSFPASAFWKSPFESLPGKMNARIPEPTLSATPTLAESSLAPIEPQTESYQEMATVRRYGNQ